MTRDDIRVGDRCRILHQRLSHWGPVTVVELDLCPAEKEGVTMASRAIVAHAPPGGAVVEAYVFLDGLRLIARPTP